MLALSSEHWLAINLILEGRRPCAREAGLLYEGVNVETLEHLESLEILCRWYSPDDAVWTLTPHAAEELDVELIEYFEPATDSEDVHTCRWAPIGRMLGPMKIPMSWRSTSIESPEDLVDPNSVEPPAPEDQLLDETGKPVLLFGSIPIKIDLRLGRHQRHRRRVG